MKSIKRIITLIMILCFGVLLTACNKNEAKASIVGSWETSGYTYTFNSDKTGSYKYGEAEMKFTYEDDGEKVPIARAIKDINCSNGVLSYVLADTVEWRRKFNNRAVKKTLSIPSWLNAKAEKAGVNFSQVLKDALLATLYISKEA